MSFDIEVPGAASPLDFETLCRALQTATSSHDNAQRQAAGQQLSSWEQQADYYPTLQTVFLTKTLPTEIRLLAVIQLKNGIDRHWRLHSHVKNALKPDDKERIRSRLFQGTVDEQEKTLALHNALVTAKVVRIDYPSEWPNALSQIIALLRSYQHGEQQCLSGALQLLLRTVKELGTARLRRSQTALQSVAPEIVYLLNQIQSERMTAWLSLLSEGRADDAAGHAASLNSLTALKTLRRLLIVGYEQPQSDTSVREFWSTSQTRFGQILNLVDQTATNPSWQQGMIGKHLLQYAKIHIDMAEQHAACFCSLPNTLDLVRAYWSLVHKFAEGYNTSSGIRQRSGDGGSSKAKTEGPLLERLALRGLLLLRACVRIAFQPAQTLKYRTPEIRAEQEAARNLIKMELWKGEFVIEIVNAIITHLFIFRASDIEAWQDDPEEWEQQEQSEGDAYEWEVRPCAERLFLDLLTNFKQLLIPPLLTYFQTVQSPDASASTKEAVYTAMGLSAAHINAVATVHNYFDFDEALTMTIVRDAQRCGGVNRLLRRRIAILISQWAPVRLSDVSRPLVYQIFQHFLNPRDETNDLVVRITAARQLRWVVDELDFNVDAFLPYTGEVLTQLLELVQQVDIDETKLAILESIRILVMRMEDKIAPFADHLMLALPQLWDRSGPQEYMVKQAVIAIMAAMVTSTGLSSQRYHNRMIPLIVEVAKPESDLHAHLMDESVALWDAMLSQCNGPLAGELIALAPLALPLLEHDSQVASQALLVIESYLLLAPSLVLEDGMRRQMLTALSGTLDSKSREQARLGAVCIGRLIRSAADLGGSRLVSLLIQDMIVSGFMDKIISNLRDAWEAHQTTGPKRRTSKLDLVSEGDYLAILARLSLAEPQLFAEMLSSFGGLEQVWGWLSAEWFWHVLDVDDIDHQKLSLLGLTRLLELPSPMQELCLGKLQDYLQMWVTVIIDLQEGASEGPDSLVWGEDLGDTEYDTPKMTVERLVTARDPIHTVHARHFVTPRLHDLAARVGGEAAFEANWAVNVDRDLLHRFREIAQGGQRPGDLMI